MVLTRAVVGLSCQQHIICYTSLLTLLHYTNFVHIIIVTKLCGIWRGHLLSWLSYSHTDHRRDCDVVYDRDQAWGRVNPCICFSWGWCVVYWQSAFTILSLYLITGISLEQIDPDHCSIWQNPDRWNHKMTQDGLYVWMTPTNIEVSEWSGIKVAIFK